MRIGGEHPLGVIATDAERTGDEYGLVVIAGQRSGQVILDQGTFAATLAATTNLQRLGQSLSHNKRLIVADCSILARNGRRYIHRPGESGVLTVVFKHSRRVVHYYRRMVGFGSEGASDLMGHVHTVATLVVQDDTVSPGRHSTVHTKGGCGIRNCAVVAVYAKA